MVNFKSVAVAALTAQSILALPTTTESTATVASSPISVPLKKRSPSRRTQDDFIRQANHMRNRYGKKEANTTNTHEKRASSVTLTNYLDS